jgi:hypothetical protein
MKQEEAQINFGGKLSFTVLVLKPRVYFLKLFFTKPKYQVPGL